MPDSSPFEPYPPLHQELEQFQPCGAGWFALYAVQGKASAVRQRVAGWGTYYDAGELVVVAMVPNLNDCGMTLVPAGRIRDFMGVQHTGDYLCDCDEPPDDIYDPDWCPTCQGDIRR